MALLESVPAPEGVLDSTAEATASELNVDGKDLPTVEPNVIDTVSSESVSSDKLKSDDIIKPDSLAPLPTSSEPSSPSSNSPSSPGRLSGMPGLADLSQIILHSPSQIVGTPYAINSTRFEYPFPDTSLRPSSESPPSSTHMNSVLPPSVASGSSFPAISISTSSFQISVPMLSYPIPPTSAPSYNSAHPKLKRHTNPPIPPSLTKKRTRWSLNLIGRRKSSSAGSQSSTSSTTSGDSSLPMIDGVLSQQQINTPNASPREDQGPQ